MNKPDRTKRVSTGQDVDVEALLLQIESLEARFLSTDSVERSRIAASESELINLRARCATRACTRLRLDRIRNRLSSCALSSTALATRLFAYLQPTLSGEQKISSIIYDAQH